MMGRSLLETYPDSLVLVPAACCWAEVSAAAAAVAVMVRTRLVLKEREGVLPTKSAQIFLSAAERRSMGVWSKLHLGPHLQLLPSR